MQQRQVINQERIITTPLFSGAQKRRAGELISQSTSRTRCNFHATDKVLKDDGGNLLAVRHPKILPSRLRLSGYVDAVTI